MYSKAIQSFFRSKHWNETRGDCFTLLIRLNHNFSLSQLCFSSNHSDMDHESETNLAAERTVFCFFSLIYEIEVKTYCPLSMLHFIGLCPSTKKQKWYSWKMHLKLVNESIADDGWESSTAAVAMNLSGQQKASESVQKPHWKCWLKIGLRIQKLVTNKC